MRVTQLQLSNFRNFEQKTLPELAPMTAIIGANGVGKTNILEAISLLTPGKGLRGATMAQMMRQSSDHAFGWGVKGRLESGLDVSTGWQSGMTRRGITIGADENATQKDLAEIVTAHWLTPAMDRLLAEAPAGRRRFIDRLVFALDPAHAGRITRYEKAVTERMRLLKEGRNNEVSWLSGLELDAAHTASSIAAARISWLRRIKPYLNTNIYDGKSFPKPVITMNGFMEAGLQDNQPALILEKHMNEALQRARKKDAENGYCSVGPHRTDIVISYAQKDQDARLASTGEQKALLIALIMAQTKMLIDERDIRPILLFDDITSHLDKNRQKALFSALFAYASDGGQVFVTSADKNTLNALNMGKNQALVIDMDGSSL